MTTHDVDALATVTVILCSVVTVYVSECFYKYFVFNTPSYRKKASKFNRLKLR